MAETFQFDRLVSELSDDERTLLLERIKSSMKLSSESLLPGRPESGGQDQLPKPEEMTILARLLLFFRGLFTGKSREELLRDDELNSIAHRIELKHPGLIDRKRGLILSVFAEELKGLRDAARFFYDALDRSIERDRGSFYAFLASIELPETHERLAEEVNPSLIAQELAEKRGKFEDSELRQTAMAAYEAVFAEMSDRGRKAMYQDIRQILFLKRLSGFLFDRLLGMFRDLQSADAKPAATFLDARDLVLELGDILFSMAEPPSAALMGSILVFAEREAIGKGAEAAATAVDADLQKANGALARIRAFNGSIPVYELLKLVSRNPAYQPKELPGGEDWLVIYKAFWRERVDAALNDWRIESRTRALVEEIASFVGAPGAAGFANIRANETEACPGLKQHIALSFLDAFYRGPFIRELNRPFKLLLVDGEFYRKDNRIEFTDAYDSILRIPEMLSKLDARLGPDGEIGISWGSVRNEMGAPPIKRRKLQSIARGAEEEAEELIRRVGSAFHTMTELLQGILKGEAGGRYDSLANISYIDGKANREFLKSLERAKDRCEKAHSLLAELSGLNLSQTD